MVDPVGAKPLAQDRSITRLAPASAIARSAPVVQDRAAPQTGTGLSALIAEFAATPPVDLDRVARIRHAIANGQYPIAPETIADRLIALKLNWKPA